LVSSQFDELCSIQAPQYRDAPGGAGGGGNFLIPILSPANGDDVTTACGFVNGNDIPRQSEVTGNLHTSIHLPNDILGLSTSFRTDLRYAGSFYADQMNLQKMSPVTTVNLSVTMRNEHWNFRAFVNNVTDEDEPVNVSGGNFYYPNADPSAGSISAGSWVMVPRRPREIGLTASYSF
jgi:outer membrane receptor protein involved in Fe transport